MNHDCNTTRENNMVTLMASEVQVQINYKLLSIIVKSLDNYKKTCNLNVHNWVPFTRQQNDAIADSS